MTDLTKLSQIKIAFLFPDCVTPVNTGARVNSTSILEYLRSRGIQVTLITPFFHQTNTNFVKNYCDHLIEIPSVLRKPWWRFLNRLSNIGRKNAFSRDVVFRKLMRKRIWQALYSEKFDAIILNYVQFSEWVPPRLKSKTIVFTHDIYHLRWASLTQTPLDHPSVSTIKKNEYRELAKYPLILTVADYEFDILSKNFPLDRLLNIGAPQIVKICHKDKPNYRFGFIGANASPNVDGLIYFIQKWWPTLKHSSLGIAGSICNNQQVFKEVKAAGGTLEGFVYYLDDFYANCRWIIAPLRQGSGIKIKVLEAMARGKVVIGSSKAFEGIPITHGINALVLENLKSPATLAKTILSIEKNPRKFRQMERKALTLISEHFSFEARLEPLAERIINGTPFLSLPS